MRPQPGKHRATGAYQPIVAIVTVNRYQAEHHSRHRTFMVPRMVRAIVLLFAAAVVAACQAEQPPVVAEPPPPTEAVAANLKVHLTHGACSGPPCPVGMVEILGSGERVTIYDYDLMPLALSDADRMRMTQAMFSEAHLVRGEIERRTGFLAVERPVEVLVVDAVIGPA